MCWDSKYFRIVTQLYDNVQLLVTGYLVTAIYCVVFYSRKKSVCLTDCAA